MLTNGDGRERSTWRTIRDVYFRGLVFFLLALLVVQYGLNFVVTKRYNFWSRVIKQYMNETNGNISQVRRLISRGEFGADHPRGPLRFLLMDPKGNSSRNAFPDVRNWEAPPLCPETPPNLVGQIPVTFEKPSLSVLEQMHPELEPGGWWRPSNCTARHRVAIIIPYRDRPEHLNMFLNHMHPFLQKQQLDYAIYVIEQTSNSSFNRAMLLNIGFVEASKIYDYQCYIFHDVDLLPENDKNLYSCPQQPRHMSAAIDTMAYRLLYEGLFGGVEAFKKEHFEKINGFSNLFFGWGGEDDDLFNRLKFHGLTLTRYPMRIARYKMIRHHKGTPSKDRFKYLNSGKFRFLTDGLNSLKYDRKKLERTKTFTRILVDINETLIKRPDIFFPVEPAIENNDNK